MARPLKQGLDYFPCDTGESIGIRILIRRFGMKGFGTYVALLKGIYGENGYYLRWSDDVKLLFSGDYGLSGGFVSEIVECAFQTGLFDRAQYETNGILTSREIQRVYLHATKKRKHVTLDPAYCLIEKNEAEVSGDMNAQSKEKKSKAEESTSKHSRESILTGARGREKNKTAYGEFKNVYLTDANWQMLPTALGQSWQTQLEKLSAYKQSHPKFVSADDYATLKLWHTNDQMKVAADKPQDGDPEDTKRREQMLDESLQADIDALWADLERPYYK